jgi:hypothetical protein
MPVHAQKTKCINKETVKHLKCSPNKEGISSYTCFTKQSLSNIARSYNQIHSTKIKLTQSKRKLYNNLTSILGSNENIWLDIPYVAEIHNKDMHNSLRPKMPESWAKNKYTWLSTPELTDVMVQYQKKYKTFKYLGTVPVDCPTSISCELSNIDLQDLINKKKTKLGIIFNLDTHNQPGSHWVAMYINISNNIIAYYDSYGFKYPSHINKFIKVLITKFKNIGRTPKVLYNSKRHQYGSSECGIYSINFILESLKNKSFDNICQQNIPDAKMNEMRNILYR